jgi:hypothetical protein
VGHHSEKVSLHHHLHGHQVLPLFHNLVLGCLNKLQGCTGRLLISASNPVDGHLLVEAAEVGLVEYLWHGIHAHEILMEHLEVRGVILGGTLREKGHFLLFIFIHDAGVKWDVVQTEFWLDFIPHRVGGLGKERLLGHHVPLEKVPLIPTLNGEPAM